ncbi:hypothetical protein FEM48_Zijuj07G0083000 [Ziziphus jujuba var. spinosa]|uniref:Uncharacterized protein n=1 Tax=Ziziphus jujuba var. spinosa TaxID=714518 RepID=A0A978V3I6_ZIZJJ|nr:hypothetical protein FEM48_Zijuj07G0083000 [Ziziphus jujuba var. spinosa]
MAFYRGEEVEVCSREDGFLGSYYAATLVAHLENMNILKNKVRPMLPEMVATDLEYLDKVDTFDNKGDEIAYPVSRLRFHLDWRSGKWVSSKKSLLPSSANSTC